MKISETSWWMFAIVEGIECRLTKRSRSEVATKLKSNLKYLGWFYIDDFGIYRYLDHSPILIVQSTQRVVQKMRKLWYKDFDFDSKEYSLVKCYK